MSLMYQVGRLFSSVKLELLAGLHRLEWDAVFVRMVEGR